MGQKGADGLNPQVTGKQAVEVNPEQGPWRGTWGDPRTTIFRERGMKPCRYCRRSKKAERDSEAKERPWERLNKGFYEGTQIPGESSLSLGHSGRGSFRTVTKCQV